MKTKSVLLGCFLFVLVLSGCRNASSQDANSESQQEEKKEEKIKINVETTQVGMGEAIAVYRSTAILEADRQATITTKSSGIILQLLAEEGDVVKEGDVVLVLESDEQRLRVQSARANYEKSQNQLERAELLLKKGISNTEAVDNLRFETKALKASLDQAVMDLSFTKVKAPFGGIISKRLVKIGNLVSQNTPVFEIMDPMSLQAKIDVPEHHWVRIRKDLPVRFLFDAIPDQILEGTVERRSPAIDAATGTFKVTVVIDNEDQMLRPGLFAKADIIYDQKQDVLLLDKEAVITEDSQSYVYLAIEDDKVEKRIVQLGYEMTDAFEITDGLDQGLTVVTTGKNNLTPDALIEIVDYQ
ncbi:efflux RND transporter periplasmic adaptor subunit [Marinicella sp. W31]|uniref:efflux RND transporter periplasmic adaptor subunit n=1 Tax=Marinicella sp. W31 TaxID=3023713 RepID=UPI0037574316